MNKTFPILLLAIIISLFGFAFSATSSTSTSSLSRFEQFEKLSILHATDVDTFFANFLSDIEGHTPLYYTPGVGDACQNYGRLKLTPNSLVISLNDKGNVPNLLEKWEKGLIGEMGKEIDPKINNSNIKIRNVSVVVVTDGERILGLGDLGVWGMGIPVGKLALYTAMGGIDPSQTLPVVIDAGTNNERLLNDPEYKGLKQKRNDGQEFLSLVDEFVVSLRSRFPGVLLQFEDFGGKHAFYLLDRFKNELATFNDDIQGTAAVSVAGLLGAFRGVGGNTQTNHKFSRTKVLFLGAGQAAVGIADLIAELIVEEEGVSPSDARQRLVMVDSKGLVHAERRDLVHFKKPYAHNLSLPIYGGLGDVVKESPSDLAKIIRAFRPQALIGVSGQKRSFTANVLQEMSKANPAPARPVIFALSNPTDNSECTAQEAYIHTENRALFASGSPFPVYDDSDGKRHVPGQANNCYVFPGIGLGVSISRSKSVNQKMMLAAARALAKMVKAEDLEMGRLFPPLSAMRKISPNIAAAVARTADEMGKSQAHSSNWEETAIQAMYVPAALKSAEKQREEL